MKKILSVLFMFLLIAGQTIAQTVSGRVTASEGTPLPGVSVLVKGTTTGLTTDSEGRYSITVEDESSVLIFSFIGFVTQEIVVGNRSTIDVELVEDITQLGEVVVTALGIPRETKTLVYATQTVKPSTLTEVRDANNVLNSLQGKIANALITQGSGGPGSGARIVLRGNRSIQGSNNALIVVDGVPITNGTTSTAGSDFGSVQSSDGASNINPDDIESVTILRGASAAALYGSQAGNGVILITTKKGGKDRMSVTLNSGITADKAMALPDVQNEYGQGNGGNIDASLGESWGARMTGQSFTGHMGEERKYSAQPDNIKDFFRTGISLNNSIGVSGGSDKMQTYLSYTNNKVEGIMPKNEMLRHTVNLRLTNQVSDKFSTDGKITYINQKIDNRPRTGEENAPVSNIFQIPRNVSLADAKNFEVINNLGVPEPTFWPATQRSIYQNPYWMIHRTAINEKRDRIIGFLSGKFNITNWLSITGRANLDRIMDQDQEQYSQGTILFAPAGGRYTERKIVTTQEWYDLILEGRNNIGSDFKIEYRAGAIYQDNNYDFLYNDANGLNVTNKFSLNYASSPTISQNAVQSRIQSVFGQVNVAFMESIFLDASIRNDWDSRLPPPYTFSYPSVGISAVLSDLFDMGKPVSLLKLSANYAVVGNGGQPQIRFNTFNYQQGAGHGFIARNQTLAITDLKPELVKNLEIGLDAKFAENRLGLSLTFYESHSTNQLLQVGLPTPTGYGSKYINAGDIENRGVELVIDAIPVRSNRFSWDINFNLGMNRNKIIELDPNLKIFYLGGGFGRSATPVVEEEKSYGDLLAFRWKQDENGNRVVTPEGVPVWTEEQEHIGSFNPDATLGLTNNVTIGPLFMRLLIDGRVGGIVVSGSEMNQAFNGIPEVTAKYREGGWNLGGVGDDGSVVNAPITSQQFWQTASGGRYGAGEFFAYDATNFRVRELSLGIGIPVPANFFIKSAKFSVVARNLFFLYRGKSILDIPGLGKRRMSFDPDMALGNGNWQGIQYYTLPSTRSLGFNLQLSL
jgi:TonB-linked SusC/RagA family outer membrane protein